MTHSNCPTCRNPVIWMEYDGASINGRDHWKICCDVDEAYCKHCDIHLPCCENGHFMQFLGYMGQQMDSSYIFRPNCESKEELLRPFEDCDIKFQGPDVDLEAWSHIDIICEHFVADLLQRPYGVNDKDVSGFLVGDTGGALTYWWCYNCKDNFVMENK